MFYLNKATLGLIIMVCLFVPFFVQGQSAVSYPNGYTPMIHFDAMEFGGSNKTLFLGGNSAGGSINWCAFPGSSTNARYRFSNQRAAQMEYHSWSETFVFNFSDPSQAITAYGDVNWLTRMSIKNNGDVNIDGRLAIGTNNCSGYALNVEGVIGARKVKVKTGQWCDFVFDKDYQLMSLGNLENYLNEHRHLPNVPSEAEVLENGIDVAEMDAILLRKIEELVLYVIEQDKKISNLEAQIDELQSGQ